MGQWTKRELKKLQNDPNIYPWDDLRFPLIGNNLDSASTRYEYDFFNGAVNFSGGTAARYPNEPISMIAQMPHEWVEESTVRPHLHWLQQAAGPNNWLLAYKKYSNDNAATVSTDYTGHTLVVGEDLFTYSSGVLVQITTFGDITMKDMKLSDMIHMVLFRDSANTSTLFSGADTVGDLLALEIDLHYQKRGSLLNDKSDKGVYLGSYFEYEHLQKEYMSKYGK